MNAPFSWAQAPVVTATDMDVRYLARNAFHGIKNIKRLTLRRLNLTTIEEGAFENSSSLRNIQISECPLATLDGIKNLRDLTQLMIKGASIKSFQYDYVKGLHSLKILDISEGVLENIFPDIAGSTGEGLQPRSGENGQATEALSCSRQCQHPLLNLTNLIFSQNSIEFILPGVFCCFPSLRDLTLSNNLIRDLSATSFIGLKNLINLALSSNNIMHFPKGIFNFLPKLQILKMDMNYINFIYSDSFVQLPLVSEIVHSYTLASVTILRLDKNNITEIEKYAFQKLPSLKVLSMRHNHITNLGMGMFHGLIQLEMLILSYNHVTHISGGTFATLNMIKYIHLYSNKIELLDSQVFSNCTHLERLDLGHNKIKEIHPDHFTDLINVKMLSLDSNKITSIQVDTFKAMMKLSTLSLRSNQIHVIDTGTFLHTPSLNVLNLRNNQIQNLTKGMFLVKQYLNLLDNPLHCTCGMLWMKNVAQNGASRYLPLCMNAPKYAIYEYLDNFCCEMTAGGCQFEDPKFETTTVSLPQIQGDVYAIIITGTMLLFVIVITIVIHIFKQRKCK